MKKRLLAIATGLGLIVTAACSTDEAAGGDPVTAEPSITSPKETDSTSDSPDTSDYPKTWEDKMAGVNHGDMVEEYRREMLDGRKYVAEMHGNDLDVDLEDYPTIRIVGQDEWAEVQAECMQDKGFKATAKPGQGLSQEMVGTDQAEAKERAYTICLIQYPVDPVQYGDLPSDEIARLYDHYVNTSKPCIEELGHSVSEPPTKETWIDQYKNGTEIWSPYAPLHDLGPIANVEEIKDEAYRQCPSYPDDFWPSID